MTLEEFYLPNTWAPFAAALGFHMVLLMWNPIILKAGSYNLPPQPITVKARDGVTDCYGLMFKPSNLDPAKKYPLLVLMHEGLIERTGMAGVYRRPGSGVQPTESHKQRAANLRIQRAKRAAEARYGRKRQVAS